MTTTINGGSDAKLTAYKNSCTLDDIELCEKGIEAIWTVDEDGDFLQLKQNYVFEAYSAYFYCNNCQETWDIEKEQSHLKVWPNVKEHLDE